MASMWGDVYLQQRGPLFLSVQEGALTHLPFLLGVVSLIARRSQRAAWQHAAVDKTVCAQSFPDSKVSPAHFLTASSPSPRSPASSALLLSISAECGGLLPISTLHHLRAQQGTEAGSYTFGFKGAHWAQCSQLFRKLYFLGLHSQISLCKGR